MSPSIVPPAGGWTWEHLEALCLALGGQGRFREALGLVRTFGQQEGVSSVLARLRDTFPEITT